MRALPALFPPASPNVEARVRRVVLTLLLALTLIGLATVTYLGRTQHTFLLSIALVATLVATAVPWHKLTRDAFAIYCVFVIGWVAWWVAISGGAFSPNIPVTFAAVALCAISLSRFVGGMLAIVAATAASLPLLYQRDIPQIEQQELIVRTLVLIVAAIALTWLTEEVRKAIEVATADRTRLQSEQEVSSELRRAQDQRTEYLSVLAHELRNPLNGINAAARVLAKEVQGDKAETTARAIANEARHAMELLDGLSDVASLESGRMRLALRPMDISAVVQEIATMVEEHSVQVRGSGDPLVVLGDDRRLAQVVRNLIGNAAKYSPPGAEINVSLGMSADRRNAIVQVRDQGPGIPPGERGQLFQRFQRLSTAGGTRGSGLGLYISRGIVKDHGGELWADWPPGGGSVFSFSIPLADGRAAATA